MTAASSRARPVALAALAVLSTGLAGCMGADPEDVGRNGTDLDTNTTDPGDERGQWTFEERNGTAAGANVTIGEASATREAFEVDNGTRLLRLMLETSGGDLRACVVGPRDRPSHPARCDAAFETIGGAADWNTTAPRPGTWTVTLTPTSDSPPSVEYDLLIGQRVPVGSQLV